MSAEPTTHAQAPAFETTACPICSENRGDELWPGDGWAMIRCAGCGLVYENPRITPQGLRARYQGGHTGRRLPDAPDWREYLHPEKLPERQVSDYVDSLDAVMRHVKSGRILDIGVSNGFFLFFARKAGFETTGVDIAEEMVQACRAQLGLDVRLGTLEECGFEDDAFDVVVARHVMEHIPDLASFWTEVRRVLRPDGLLAIEVPNIAGWSYRMRDLKHRVGLGKPMWAKMYLPEHIYFFSPRTLRRLADRHGFDVVEWETYSSRKRYGPLAYRLMQLRHALRTGNKMRFLLRPRPA